MNITKFITFIAFCSILFSCKKQSDSTQTPTPVAITGPTVVAGTTDALFAIDVATGQRRWQYSWNGYISPVVQGNGLTYVGSFTSVFALHDSTGILKWGFVAPNNLSVAPVLYNGKVYVTDNNGNIYALDAQTGGLIWSSHGAQYWVAVYASGNMLAASNGDNNLYAFNATTGAILWKYTTPVGGVAGPLNINNGIVYTGTFNFQLLAIDSVSGTKKWSFDVGDSLIQYPLIVNDIAYTSKIDKFYGLNASTGAASWTYSVGDSVFFYLPVVSNGNLYLCGDDNTLYALDATTGTLKWTYPTNGILDVRPLVANGILYLCSGDSTLYALDALTGIQKWKYDLAIVRAPITVINNTLYIEGINKKLYALDALSGSLKWSYTLDGYIQNAPFVF